MLSYVSAECFAEHMVKPLPHTNQTPLTLGSGNQWGRALLLSSSYCRPCARSALDATPWGTPRRSPRPTSLNGALVEAVATKTDSAGSDADAASAVVARSLVREITQHRSVSRQQSTTSVQRGDDQGHGGRPHAAPNVGQRLHS